LTSHMTHLFLLFYLLRDNTCLRVQKRSDALDSVSKDCRLELDRIGICELSEEQVQSILGYSNYQQVSRNRKGACVLNDNGGGGIAMLSYQMRKAVNILNSCLAKI